MTVSERVIGDVTILDIQGNLGLGAAADSLRDKVRSLLQQGQRHILVNLAAVAFMDSAGLGEMVQAYVTANKQGGTLKLLHLTQRLHDLLLVMKLASVFECFDDEAIAVRSFVAPT
jgi:anti-sigma B factor antagonist